MAVYVDSLRRYYNVSPWLAQKHGTVFCHLISDNDRELYEFARMIGLAFGWAQRSNSGVLHFDLTPGRRDAAVASGAIEDIHEFRKCMYRRQQEVVRR